MTEIESNNSVKAPLFDIVQKKDNKTVKTRTITE